MIYRDFGETNEKVSVLGFGLMRLPTLNGDPNNVDRENAGKMVDKAIERGINYFDTAQPYHGEDSERFFGEYLKNRRCRDKILLATKLPVWLVETEEDPDRLLNEQLERLQTDYVDFYLLHALSGKSWEKVKKTGILSFMERVKREGKVSHIGFSFHDETAALPPIFNQYDGFGFVQLQYNYIDGDFQGGLTGIKMARERGMGIVVMEPLKGGLLGNKMPPPIREALTKEGLNGTPAELALKWLWNDPAVSVILSGMSEMEQLEENIALAAGSAPDSLTLMELSAYQKVRELFHKNIKVKCTDCKYCINVCPVGVNIPYNFSLYNDVYTSLGHKAEVITRSFVGDDIIPPFFFYDGLSENERASGCTSCGACISHCPQAIAIPQELEKVALTFAVEE